MNRGLLKSFYFLAAGAAVLFADNVPSEVAVTKENVRKFYLGFQRLTKEPRSVDRGLAVLCATPSPDQIARLAPHGAWIHLYANKLAEETVRAKRPAFPVGAVVIKEKVDRAGKFEGVGGMIKRAPGYDPANGDWEYFFSDAGGFSTGRLKNCAECHAKAKEKDFVYSIWEDGQ